VRSGLSRTRALDSAKKIMRPFTPRQTVIGGCLLAFGASFLNTGFLLSTGTSVSHLTGDIARIGSGLSTLGNADGFHMVNVATATFGFILGAIISGFLLHHPTLEMSKPYGRILSALGISLVAAHYSYLNFPILSIAIASAVCGAQNALASRYRGLVLRTTHLTGLFTDLGINLGMKLRGHMVEAWKLSIPLFITLSFLLGAIASSTFVLADKDNWMLVAGIGYLIGGIAWSVYKRTRRVEQDGAGTYGEHEASNAHK
jgi:uncharacterized membrane protein YoaK (UPF0700 family)